MPPAAAPSDDARAVAAAVSSALPWAETKTPVVVAVSGGADSVGLLLALVRENGENPRRLVVAHAEHDLRGEAAADRGFVVDLAVRLDVPVSWRRLAVRARGDTGGEGLEGRARRLRYAFLIETAREVGARHVLVAHTADDQAETILHRALRGTGVAGLAGMRRSRALCEGIALVRPLLGVSRAAVRAFLARDAAAWREDASNADTARARNFLRHEVLPRCLAGPYPAAGAALVRLGLQAAGVAAALSSAANHLLDLHARRQVDGSVILLARDLARLDAALVAEMFVALWSREGWPQREMTAAHYGLAAAAVRVAPRGAGFDLPGGARLIAEAPGVLRVRPPRDTRRDSERGGSGPD